MEDIFFIFKGIKSTDMGVEMVDFPPLQFPERKTKTIEVDGMDGNYTQDLGAYSTYSMKIPCLIDGTQEQAKTVQQVLNWLKGSGKLILSNDRLRYYQARIANAIPISDVILVMPEFIVNFEVQPFKRSVHEFNDRIVTTSKKIMIKNKGDHFSLPIITLKGSGTATIKINDKSYTLQNINGYATINSEIQEVYKDDVSKNIDYKSISFPFFDVGVNKFEVIGNVAEIEIKPNWRWF